MIDHKDAKVLNDKGSVSIENHEDDGNIRSYEDQYTHTHTHPTVVPKSIRNILFPTILRGAEEVDENRAIQIEKILRCSTFV